MVLKASQAYYLAMHSLLRLHLLKAPSWLNREGEKKCSFKLKPRSIILKRRCSDTHTHMQKEKKTRELDKAAQDKTFPPKTGRKQN